MHVGQISLEEEHSAAPSRNAPSRQIVHGEESLLILKDTDDTRSLKYDEIVNFNHAS